MEVFSTAFLPPPLYFRWLLSAVHPVVDTGENFIKQTSRNRCLIVSSNGIFPIIIPLRKTGSRLVSDACISYQEPWQSRSWSALCSAYRNAPYFDEYEQALQNLWHQQPEKLVDYNGALFTWALNELYIEREIEVSATYMHENILTDYRTVDFCSLTPQDSYLPYKQVFAHKYSFIPHVSVLDLLMNKGPEARMFIDK